MGIIVVGNEKGGVGKTTLSTNLAVMAAVEGLDTLLVDADPRQQSSARWAARRLELHPDRVPVRCVSLTGVIGRDLNDLARRYQVVIVDTGAQDSREMRSAATIASLIIVPVKPDPADLWTLPTAAKIFEDASIMNPDLKVIMAINSTPAHAIGAGISDVQAWIASNVPTFAGASKTTIVNRAAYPRAMGEGLGVIEMLRSDPKAVTEISNLYEETLQ